jgi:hypothetical protein
MPKPRIYPIGHFFCRYCNEEIHYKPEQHTSEELRREKVKHFGRVHRKYRPKVWRQLPCYSCGQVFEARHLLKKHKYEVHGY